MAESMLEAQVVRFYESGDASVLKVETGLMPEPEEGEVRIQVKAIGLNRAEVMFRNGIYPEKAVFPSRIGYEASGIVDKVGACAEGFSPGDHVSSIPAFSMSQYGVYGNYAIVPAHALTKNPVGFSYQESAAIWMQYITAFGALVNIGRVKEGDNVLITAASSSVGVAAIHIARLMGARVLVTSRDDDKKAFLLAQGADEVINPQTTDLVEKVRELTGEQGVNFSFDPIGGPIIRQLADVSAQRGVIVEYGALSTDASPFPLFPALVKGLTIRGYSLFEVTHNPEQLTETVAQLKQWFESGVLTPVIDRLFDLSEIVAAHEYMESNAQKGKIVVNVP